MGEVMNINDENFNTDYEDFLTKNRIKINKYLNRVLWFFVLTGPAIAAGIKGGIFVDISYMTCVWISVVVIVLSSIHFLLYKLFPSKIITCIFALTALNVLILYMKCAHVSIYLRNIFIFMRQLLIMC